MPKTIWKDGEVQLVRHCDGVYGLEYEGVSVMDEGSKAKMTHYAWLEFLDFPEEGFEIADEEKRNGTTDEQDGRR